MTIESNVHQWLFESCVAFVIVIKSNVLVYVTDRPAGPGSRAAEPYTNNEDKDIKCIYKNN